MRNLLPVPAIIWMIFLLLPCTSHAAARRLAITIPPAFAILRTHSRTTQQSLIQRRSSSSCSRLFSSSNSSSSTTQTPTAGRLTARIVPSFKIDYQQQKSKHLYSDNQNIDSLLEQLEPISTISTTPPPPPTTTTTTPTLIAQTNAQLDATAASSTSSDVDEKTNDSWTILLHAAIPSSKGTGELLHFHSQRDANESAEKGLKRLTTNFLAKIHPPPTVPRGKKRKMKKQAVSQTPSKLPTIVRVANDEQEVEIKTRSNLELWRDLADDSSIRISFPIPTNESPTLDLELVACPPTILSVETFCRFEQCIFVGVPLHIAVQTLHAASSPPRIAWFVNKQVVQQNDSNTYIPTANDVGHKIQVVVLPTTSPTVEGAEAYEFLHTVEAIPILPVVHSLRQDWTAARAESDDDNQILRVVTYNLLADQYAKQGDIHHCSPKVLERNRRMPLLLYELLAYRADILCLQEVDWHIFDTLYQPVLESQGYQGFFTGKLSGQQEGCAMFWLTSKLTCQEQTEIGINELLLSDAQESESDADWKDHLPLFEQLPRIKSRIRDLGQILQCATLTSKANGERVIVANTHLYYHPLGDHFRVFQAYGVSRFLHSKLLIYNASDGQDECGIVLCGDLNSDPKSGTIQLLQDRRVDASHAFVWENLLLHPKPRSASSGGRRNKQQQSEFEQEKEQEASAMMASIVPPTLTLPASFPQLRSSSHDDVPVFTHCIPQFCATLDYILSSLQCVATAPTPPVAINMPNEGMPSDHISLVADYEFGQSKKSS